METLTVQLNTRSYPIYIGEDILERDNLISQHIKSQRVVIISNETVAPLYLTPLKNALKAFECHEIILPDGEQYKNMLTLETIFDALLEQRCPRDATIVALGGGVIGDITGFAAACYQRGVDFIQVPTTLLSQVDSSVGGKTGINHTLGKNMIGAFYQPQCVIADIHTLQSLPPRELSAGIAEVIKYGLLGDKDFFNWLENNMSSLMQLDSAAVTYAIQTSCQCKADIVASDEQEKSGRRALLNLGHTFGHAIETGMGYGTWLHGEAVACGMAVAAEFSARLGWLADDDVVRIKHVLESAHLPVAIPQQLSAEQMLDLMALDKKVQAGKLNLILLTKIGEAVMTHEYDQALLLAMLTDLTSSTN
jgi:3-dehydroquinate synthase